MAQRSVMAKICSNCDNEITNENDKFCAACGIVIGDEAKRKTPPPLPPSTPQKTPPPVPRGGREYAAPLQATVKTRSHHKKKLIGIALAAIICAVFYLNFSFFTIQPIGAVPKGRTLLIGRLTNMNFMVHHRIVFIVATSGLRKIRLIRKR
jgi:hypothetical protein